MLKLTQKSFKTEDGKIVAYCEATLCIDNFTYKVAFDERTKKRFNNYARKQGFTVGVVDTEPTPLAKEI